MGRGAAIANQITGVTTVTAFTPLTLRGFFVGMLGDEAIASISVVKYDDSFGFLGFYIVKPEFRGRGYGFQLWQAGLAYLQGCNIGLDGVVAQQDNYLKSGFQLAYRNIRYQGVSPDSVAAPLPAEIVPLSALPIATVIQYDRPFFPPIAPLS
jgi:GNAT superfamily N-acetyltransferase